jgi:hypothetical protein
MTARGEQRGHDPGLSHHPAPARQRASTLSLAFATMGAPAAWFVQLSVSYALFAQLCYGANERLAGSPEGAGWRWVVALAVYLVCLLCGLAATMLAVVLYRRTKGERAGHSQDIEEAGSGRTRFFAYWGILLGAGFTVVTAVNVLALLAVPPCAL